MGKTAKKLLQLQSSIILLHSREDEVGDVLGSIIGAFVAVYYMNDSTPLEKATSHALVDAFMEQFGKELDGEKLYVYMLDKIMDAILAIKELEDENENDE